MASKVSLTTAALALGVVTAAVLAAARSGTPAEATLPCRQPQLAATGDLVYAACGTHDAVLVARSTDGGRTFDAPAKIAVDGHLSLGNHRGPRIAASGDRVVVTAILGKLGGGKDGDVVAWRSSDGGRRWSDPVTVNDVPAAAREGLHAMTGHEARITVAWLDLREKGTTLAVATSADGGRTWGSDVIAYRSPSGSICECCHPSLATDGTGRIVAMFRNSADGKRDMHVTTSSDGKKWTPAIKLGRESWTLAGCPMDGGDVRYGAEGKAVTVWRRGQTVFTSALDSETTMRDERRVGDGVNPTLVVTGAGPVVAWNGPEGLQLARPNASPVLVDPRGRFASLASRGNSLIVAFERGQESVVRVL